MFCVDPKYIEFLCRFGLAVGGAVSPMTRDVAGRAALTRLHPRLARNSPCFHKVSNRGPDIY